MRGIDEVGQKLGNAIITKACKLKGITIFHEEIAYNCEIIQKTLYHSIVEMENIMLVLKKAKDAEKQKNISQGAEEGKVEEHDQTNVTSGVMLEIEVFDKDTFDRKELVPFHNEKGFTVKLGKKVKLIE